MKKKCIGAFFDSMIAKVLILCRTIVVIRVIHAQLTPLYFGNRDVKDKAFHVYGLLGVNCRRTSVFDGILVSGVHFATT